MDGISNQATINEQPLEEAKNEVLRKIGRNMLIFQQMEQYLKVLVSTSNISGYGSELKAKQASQIESVQTQTMGQLVGQYIENNNPEKNNKSDEPDDLKDVYVSISFSIETNEEAHNQQKKFMASLVEERNNLVHHFLPTFNPTSINSCVDVQKRLDTQADKVRRTITRLKATLAAFNKARKTFADFSQSQECTDYFEMIFAQQSSLANILTDLAETHAGNNGWVVLHKAVSIINQKSPTEIKNLKQNHNCKKLKDMMIKTKLFELSDEKTPKGGSRVLYRLKRD